MSATEETKSKPDIWTQSLKLLSEADSLEQRYLTGYSSLLFVGSHSGGKSSIINRFISSCESGTPDKSHEETIALEYRFAKQGSDYQANNEEEYFDLDKISHLWELGYGLLFQKLIQFVLTKQTIRQSSVFIVLDLTRPEEMTVLLESFLSTISDHIETLLGEDQRQDLTLQASKRATIYHANDVKLSPLLIPFTIVGSKYDEFQNMDPEKKKQIVRYLRAIAYFHVGQIVFVSVRSETLTKRILQTIDSLAFRKWNFARDQLDGKVKPPVSTSPTKPLLLPFGYDTLAKIGVNSLTEAREQFTSLFPQRNMQQYYISTIGTDPRTDRNFAEPEIDKLLEYKYMLLNSQQQPQ